MEWFEALALMFGCLVAIMITGLPICFGMLFTCIIGASVFWGGWSGIDQLAMSMYSSVANYVFLPIPLFILMGDVIFEAGTGTMVVDAVDKVLGKLPGRLSLVAVGVGVLLGAPIGISGGCIGILGRVLLPEMMARGYKHEMTLGPIISTGTLAILIPPSAMAVFIGAMGQVSISKLLLAITLPGILLAVLMAGYIVVRCKMNPSLAPIYDVAKIPMREKLKATLYYLVPIGVILLAVMGSIFLGVATPSESAALGVVACVLVAVMYKQFSWRMLFRACRSTVRISVMVFFIVVGSISFGRLLATSGAVTGLTEWAVNLDVPPLVIVAFTQIVLLVLGAFMDPASIVMITAPIFFPMVKELGFDMLWFATICLLSVQLGLISPPFGLDVYTMKALAPPGVTLGDCFKASMPYFAWGLVLLLMIFFIPEIATWLPSVSGAK
ncbi:MAG: TRAP transporter large permease subunit [Thermoleophilia bacterium]|nr:TRAP transporter large permease subunit [Thermoleophilia bacterium]